MLICFATLVLFGLYRPFAYERVLYVAYASYVELFLVAFVGLLLKVNVTGKQDNDNTFFNAILAALLCTVFAMPFIFQFLGVKMSEVDAATERMGNTSTMKADSQVINAAKAVANKDAEARGCEGRRAPPRDGRSRSHSLRRRCGAGCEGRCESGKRWSRFERRKGRCFRHCGCCQSRRWQP